MPSLKDIRRRIASVKNTQQVTRAMKLVSAAKLRRAQENVTAARPYAQHLESILASVASRSSEEQHPLLAARPVRKALLVCVTSDRGLCGGFNSNITRRAQRFLTEDAPGYESAQLAFVGKKGHDYFKRRNVDTRHFFEGVLGDLEGPKMQAFSQTLVDEFLSGELDGIFLLYNAFKSAGSQVVTLRQLLPVDTSKVAEDQGVEHLYEPDRAQLLEALASRYVTNQLHTVLLDSIAAEHAARMVAMEGASSNAAEMIDKLTLEANRARQAMITKELLEIVAGAEAL